jgi:RecJ-like exonuclease
MPEGGESYSPETCTWCYGRGRRSVTERCEVCGGKGKLMVLQPARRCTSCNCTGRSGDTVEKCPRCGGSGWEGVLSARVAPGN